MNRKNCLGRDTQRRNDRIRRARKMTKDNNTKVCVAINAVQNSLKAGIPKDHKNAMQGYNFRGIDDIYNVVGPLLPEHGLVILPRMLSRECEVYKNQKGTTMFHVVVKAEYCFKSHG